MQTVNLILAHASKVFVLSFQSVDTGVRPSRPQQSHGAKRKISRLGKFSPDIIVSRVSHSPARFLLGKFTLTQVHTTCFRVWNRLLSFFIQRFNLYVGTESFSNCFYWTYTMMTFFLLGDGGEQFFSPHPPGTAINHRSLDEMCR